MHYKITEYLSCYSGRTIRKPTYKLWHKTEIRYNHGATYLEARTELQKAGLKMGLEKTVAELEMEKMLEDKQKWYHTEK